MNKVKYYLIINEEDWVYRGEDEVRVSEIVVKEFDTLEKAKSAKGETYDDSLIIEGNIIDGKLKDFLNN